MPKPNELVLVADENFDYSTVKALRSNGFSVIAIAETFPSIDDTQVLQIAVDKNALLLTEDKDFGELVHRLRMPHCGILLVRIARLDNTEKSKRVCEVIETRGAELFNCFSVLTNDQLRVKPSQPK